MSITDFLINSVEITMKKTAIALSISLMAGGSAYAATFTNGGFEDGNFNAWDTGGGYRGAVLNNNANFVASNFLPGGLYYNAAISHSQVVSAGIAPHTDGNLNQVYSGNFSARAEDVVNGGYASAIQQSVTNYTDNSIFFAWAAVLEGAHGVNDAATFKLTLTDNTTNSVLVSRQYNAASGGGGVDARFTLSSDGYYYTDWQIEQIDVSAFVGHDFTLSLLAADCQPTGHAGYVYLDGFGAFVPPPGRAPEPASLALMGLGLAGFAAARKRKTA